MDKGLEREERLMVMGEMAASLAHEIRNPLGSMELFCTLLKQDLKEEPERFKLAEQIHSSIKTVDKIISNCLQFTRDVKPNVKKVYDIEALFNESLHFVLSVAKKSNIEVEVIFKGEKEIYTDSYLIKQVISNLSMNAVEALIEEKKEGGKVKVISDTSNSDFWRIEFIDNGKGISEEIREKVFYPFFSTKKGGTGLGLSIVSSIVSSLKGSISIEGKNKKENKILCEFPKKQFKGID